MTNQERKDFYMNRNIKLIPSYLALTWDVLFVWTISIMFFTNQKGLTYSQTIVLDSILMIMGCVMCLFLSKAFQNVSPLTASKIANFGYAAYLLLCIFGTSFITFVVAQFFLAFAYSLKSVKDNLILTESLTLVKRDKEYERVYGKGLSYYYILEAIGAIVITYVYDWNAYAAYWISLAIVGFATLYSFLIKNPTKFQQTNIKIDPKQETVTNKIKKTDGYFKILASGFVMSMMIYTFFFRGVISVDSSLFKIYLQDMIDLNVLPLWSFGYIYAGARICVALSSKYQFKYNLKFGVRSLLLFNVAMIGSYALNGILFLVMPTNYLTIILIVVVSYIQISLRIPNQIFINNYIQTCVPKKNIEKVYAIRTTFEYLGYALMTLICSGLLTKFNNNYGIVNVVYISIFAVPLIISMIFFIRLLCKRYAQKYTIIKKEYTED
ncbi:MAG: hypothetical protein IKM43_01885 [Clostridia bacterium]|nr:hypothetical protein [Clostridia bacterium]